MSGEVYSRATMRRSWVRRFVSNDDREPRLRRAGRSPVMYGAALEP